MPKYLLDRLFAFSGTALGIGLTRAFSITLFVISARSFAPEVNGSFIQAVAIPQIVAQLAMLGWLPLIVREVSGRPEIPDGRFKGFLTLATAIPLSSIAIVSIAIGLFGWFDGRMAFYGSIAAYTAAYSIALLSKEYLLALKLPAFGTLVSEGFPFAFASLLMWMFRPATAEQAVGYLICGSLIAIAIGLPIVWRQLRHYATSCKAEYDALHWLRSSLFCLLGNGGRSLLDRLDVIILSSFALTAQLALYNSSLRIANLLLLPSIILLPVFSPHLSEASKNNDRLAIRRDMQLQTLVIALFGLPFAGVLLTYPDLIIGFVFGDSYRNVEMIMTFMIISQLTFAFSLPWSNLALMRGRVRLYGVTNFAAFVVGLGCSAFLLPKIGAAGVAVGSMIANTLLALAFFAAELPRLTGSEDA